MSQRRTRTQRGEVRVLCRLDISKLKTSGVKLMLLYSVIHPSCCMTNGTVAQLRLMKIGHVLGFEKSFLQVLCYEVSHGPIMMRVQKFI